MVKNSEKKGMGEIGLVTPIPAWQLCVQAQLNANKWGPWLCYMWLLRVFPLCTWHIIQQWMALDADLNLDI